MAKLKDRLAQNVPGQFYVDLSCIYCGFCDEIAPDVFRHFGETRLAYVHRQPVTDAQKRLCYEAVQGCPTDSIGIDGDKFD